MIVYKEIFVQQVNVNTLALILTLIEEPGAIVYKEIFVQQVYVNTLALILTLIEKPGG